MRKFGKRQMALCVFWAMGQSAFAQSPGTGIPKTSEARPAPAHAGAELESGQLPAISIRVYNYARASAEILEQAENGSTEIFRAAGVGIVWTNCELPEDSNCAEYLDSAHLGVRLLPDIAPTLGGTDRTMGLAVGNLASVSVRRVREEAAAFEVSVRAVLAPTLAHEIGHLLLVAQGHSPSGIMRAQWRREDYERAPRGAFRFTSQQAQSIRAEVRRREQERAAGELMRTTASK